MGFISNILELVGVHQTSYDFIPSLEGAWAPNNQLEAAQEVFAPASTPDAVAAHRDGFLLVAAGQELHRLDDGKPTLLMAFPGQVTAIHADADGSIWVGCEGQGIIRIDASGKELSRMVEIAGVRLRCMTAITKHSDGTLVVALGSAAHDAENWVFDLMQHGRSGRIVVSSANGGERVLADNLGWPSGIAIDRNGRLCVTLAWQHCVRRYGLDGRLIDTPLPNLPAYAGGLTQSDDGHFWLALFAMRTQLIDFVLREDEFRADMMRSVDPRYWIRPALLSEDSYLEPLQGGSIKKLGITKAWAPPRSYGLVVEFDQDFSALRSFHSRVGGRHHGVMSAIRHDGKMIAAAKGAGMVLSIDLEQA